MKRTGLFHLIIILLLGLSLLFGAGCTTTTEENADNVTSPAVGIVLPEEQDIPISHTSVQSLELPNIADVVAKVKPSVVAIETEIEVAGFFGPPTTQESAGSGWIISTDGYIVTNNHVVEGARCKRSTNKSIRQPPRQNTQENRLR